MNKNEKKTTLFGCPEEPRYWMYRTAYTAVQTDSRAACAE